MGLTTRSIARLSCWRLLQVVYVWITCCVGFVSYLRRFFCVPASHSVKKLPRHLALLVDSEDVVLHVSKVIMLLQQLAQLGLRHVSLYDAKGVIEGDYNASKRGVCHKLLTWLPSTHTYTRLLVPTEMMTWLYCTDRLVFCGGNHGKPYSADVAARVLRRRLRNFCQLLAGDESLNQGINDTCLTPCERKDCLLVELLCLQDGKLAIVEAARNICLKSLQSSASSNLREDDIDTSLKEIGGIGPDPDLLLLFSSSRCLQGYPPWRLRLTEIQ
ncbi:hypothetical protein GOP47_0009569 [Adiantum capillus-veneris]|uniref:ditrans,polycis-polyprenyl diphosphate synthase [(2E,6E)-farnesyldiphosphate specific] n=1 Tax=Adiantum capillus-veneris TaxID=13818 RepID=A0A9D4UWT2_ADICA|nr:hypothetical protein GOP47_0009569 [Adiantum capillus-veneris]